MSGRVAIITGANSGIGFKVAEYMCEAGDNVFLACRSEEKGKAAVDKIKKKNPQALAHFLQLDLNSQESIKKFVEEFRATGKKLSVLICNAGLAMLFKGKTRTLTEEKFEMTMATNHLGHFLLVDLLLEDLKKTGSDTGNARVIVVASSQHDVTKIPKQSGTAVELDLEDLFLVKPNAYSGIQAYKNSKACNIMFAHELAKKLDGSGVSVNAVCPGFIPTTNLGRNNGAAARAFLKYGLGGILKPMMKQVKSISDGATMIFDLADDEKYKGVTGKYFSEGKEAESSEETRDEEKQKKLWELTGGYLKMEGFEPLEVPEPPPEPEPVVEEKKEEKKEETTEEKKEEEKEKAEEKKEEEKEDEKKIEEKDVDELKKEAQAEDNKTEEIKAS